MTIRLERIRILTPSLPQPVGEGVVVYWMNRDKRLQDNWALLYAQHIAIERRVSLHIVYCIDHQLIGMNPRQDTFIATGLQELAHDCIQYNISFQLLHGDSHTELSQWLYEIRPSILITDFEPLRNTTKIIDTVVATSAIPVIQVDAHNIVPCWHVSQKVEFAAYTIRPKIKRLLPNFLEEFPPLVPHPFSDGARIAPYPTMETSNSLMGITPGEGAARAALEDFVQNIQQYNHRNDPTKRGQSNLSPYLHTGQLAPQRAALDVNALSRSGADDDPVDSFLEELIIRRELADNFTFYNYSYDSFDGFPMWAQQSLNEHRNDHRTYVYTFEEWEGASTHDPLWNAAQQELLQTGKMHGYMRMYWAKKLLEWSASPEEALAVGIALNDMYELDGLDPNGYAGLAWSIGGVHDRAWFQRPVYGKIRYMNANGCARKFDTKEYIRRYANPTLL